MSLISTQCQNKINACFCTSLYIKNTLYVNRIEPRTGTTIIIEGLKLSFDCLTLNSTTVEVGCGASNGAGIENTSVGINAGTALTSGAENTLLGFSAGQSLTTGGANTYLGANAGFSASTGTSNVSIGYLAGRIATVGSGNTIVGATSGLQLTTGGNNIVVGAGTLSTLATGNYNVIIGTNAGSNTSADLSGCVILGTRVGRNNTTNNRLMIDNNNVVVDTPLVDGIMAGGDSATASINFNGTVTIGNETNPATHYINTTEETITLADNGFCIPIITPGNQTRYIKLWDEQEPP